MKIYSIYDPEFKQYGQIVDGMEESIQEILAVLKDTPQGDSVEYVAEYEPLQELPAMTEISEHCYGGMPVELGWCNGHNTKLNCLEYHRDSEYNLGTENLILLLAKREQITDGVLDTAAVKAFRVPAGVLVEIYATTLHYAPCHDSAEKGFRMMVALPQFTNTEKPQIEAKTFEDRLLLAKNKWLLAHPDSDEAKNGAYVGLVGENIDIAPFIGDC